MRALFGNQVAARVGGVNERDDQAPDPEVEMLAAAAG